MKLKFTIFRIHNSRDHNEVVRYVANFKSDHSNYLSIVSYRKEYHLDSDDQRRGWYEFGLKKL